MVVEFVVGPIISGSVAFLLGKITSSGVVSYLMGKKDSGFDKLLQKLETKFLAVSAVLADAEKKEDRNPAVKNWLDKLQDVVDDAEDLFGEIEYDVLKLKVEAESRSGKNKVRKFVTTIFNSTDRKRKIKMEEILGRLENFENQINGLGLERVAGEKLWQSLPSTSLMEDSIIYGRDNDKSAVMKLIMSDDEQICVIPIVGMGGVGKTTLAQSIFNDNKIVGRFELKLWVCVSNEFDVCRVTKSILGEEEAKDVNDLNSLQDKLKKKLTGKRYLIVLDDVWNEDYNAWNNLKKPFKDGAPGSKIIVTTRNEDVASIMGTVTTHHLKQLTDEECWDIFAKHASSGTNGDFTSNKELERIGREIGEKCKGLPLAATTLGGLLRSTLDVEKWERIANSEFWELPENKSNILPALRLSYHYLPSHLKQCFAYCSLFPKDYKFEKDELVLQWMAEGLLEPPKGSEIKMEDLGNEYFDNLISRSFLQRSNVDGSHFVMHDLIVDLARFVSKKIYFFKKEGKSNEIVLAKRAHHIAYDMLQYDEIFKSVPEATIFDPKGYLSFDYNELLVHRLLKLSYLRYLSLSGYLELEQLPKSIGNLRHLRYLDLSWTSIEELPKSLCILYNLQTLKLSFCYSLTKLPKNFHHLINLRYLNVDGSDELVIMPKEISKLKSLRRLIGLKLAVKEDGANLRDLAELSNLSGRLSICDLQNVVDDAGATILRENKYLVELKLEWSDEKASVSEDERDVLDQLLPNTTLKELHISNYGGRAFSEWLGYQSFYNLVNLNLSQCKYCEILPPLGQLPSLKTLYIRKFDAIETVGLEFYGTNSSVVKPFPALESLVFYSLSNWMKWSMPIENVVAFPQLRTLSLSQCHRLTGDLPCVLPSLIELSISCCSELVQFQHTYECLQNLSIDGDSCRSIKSVSLDSFPNIKNLQIEGCENLESFSLRESLKDLSSLCIYKCPNFTFSPDSNLHCPSLTKLQLINCEKLKLLPKQLDSLLPSLQSLKISNCPKLKSSPRSRFPSSLRELEICDCEKYVARKNWNLEALPNLTSFTIGEYRGDDMESFPEQGWLLPTTLTYLHIRRIDCLKSLDGEGFQQLTSLKELFTFECPKLETLPEEGLPTSLAYLNIHKCPLLEQKCQRNTGEYWNNIARIPHIWINFEKVHSLNKFQ